jgi:hypothetical protein
MKKLSVISAVLMITVVFIMAFAINSNSVSKENTGNVISPNPSSTVTFHLKNCTNCDRVAYCLDGSGITPAGSCVFSIECKGGEHTICILCDGTYPGNGNITFDCKTSHDITVDCNAMSVNCTCDLTKKK